jgi:hypothetical protein
MANSSHSGSYLNFSGYSIKPSVGLGNISGLDPSSNSTHVLEVQNNGLLINSSVSTTGKSVEVGSAQTNATVRINTGQDVSGQSVSIARLSQNPGSSNFGARDLGKFVQIEVSDGISSNLTWAVISISYTDSELASTNLQEGSLRIHYYNETNGSWSAYDPPSGGVNESDNIVWANTTHFSTFGVFGSQATSQTAQSGGGGSRSSGSSGAAPAKIQPIAQPTQPPAKQTPEESTFTVPDQTNDVEAQNVPRATEREARFNPPRNQPSANLISGFFTFGLGANSTESITGYFVSPGGSPNPMGFFALAGLAVAGSVIYIKRELIFRGKKNIEYEEREQAGMADGDSVGEDADPSGSGQSEQEKQS